MAFHPETDGQTEVVNQMIMHILCMYKSNHPRTWDENLPYVHNSYIRALDSSISHNPFQVGLGFQPSGSIDVALPLVVTSTNSSPAPTKVDKATQFIEWIQHICQQVHEAEIMPYMTPSEDSTTLLWAIHYHQGCGG
jgi:hypothetical protein